MNEPFIVIPKNSREEIHVSLTVVHGHNVIDVRVYAVNRDNKLVPTTKGITMEMKRLPAFTHALREAERYVRQAGLLSDA